ncbi:MAG: HAD family hydrolase [Akkermansiaceae bacterium]|nr:HAD family hydrolase [Akkermansiaceae bacterium]
MTIAIIHYHLHPGGVTRVIERTSQALTAAGIKHVILIEDRISNLPPTNSATSSIRQVPGIGYRNSAAEFTPEQLASDLRSTAAEALGGPPELWHFHNHSLGKNPILHEVVARLAEQGERLLLQIHDLAEQGRPINYTRIANHRKLYPFSSRIHYAFINSRDRQAFITAGLPAENASILPNPIDHDTDSSPEGHHTDSPLLFAPIRGIRRKNLGELVLLAALAPLGTRIAISRAPLDPTARSIHDDWKKTAGNLGLPIEFDVVDRLAPRVGTRSNFETWIHHATHLTTTSVSEGFGLTYLEAAAANKPLIGRSLLHLTTDHAAHGIHAGHLYERTLIPSDWVDSNLLRDQLTTTLTKNYRAYGRPLNDKTIEHAWNHLKHGSHFDFGNLPENIQKSIIVRTLHADNHPSIKIEDDGHLRSASDWLASAIQNRIPTVKRDQLGPYSNQIHLERISEIYQNLSEKNSSPTRYLSSGEVLSSFLSPTSFHFLLSESNPVSIPSPSPRAVIFDIYGTLLIAPSGGVKPDQAADPRLREILTSFGHHPPDSPSTELHQAVLRHHATSQFAFPEVDLRQLWREILGTESDTGALVDALEAEWHPASPMPGAIETLQRLASTGVLLGVLSNAQSNTLTSLGNISELFEPDLTLLSYQHGIAKPSPRLFELLAQRLGSRGITPAETLFVGNDPRHDIAPAAEAGFKTALFTGHPESLRSGDCTPNINFTDWNELFF